MYMSEVEIIAALRRELRRVKETIRTLEAIDSKQSNRKFASGRISMGEAERREVSERIKKYWRDKKSAQEHAPRANKAGV